MSDIYLPPNMEALLSQFLRDQPELEELVDDRVYTVIPKRASTSEAGAQYPLVRVTQLLDTPIGSPLWAVAYDMQIDAWGGSKSDAWRIAATCRSLIDARFSGEYEGFGVVNGSTPGSLFDLPDEDFKPAKPRWIFSSTIFARPVATISS